MTSPASNGPISGRANPVNIHPAGVPTFTPTNRVQQPSLDTGIPGSSIARGMDKALSTSLGSDSSVSSTAAQNANGIWQQKNNAYQKDVSMINNLPMGTSSSQSGPTAGGTVTKKVDPNNPDSIDVTVKKNNTVTQYVYNQKTGVLTKTASDADLGWTTNETYNPRQNGSLVWNESTSTHGAVTSTATVICNVDGSTYSVTNGQPEYLAPGTQVAQPLIAQGSATPTPPNPSSQKSTAGTSLGGWNALHNQMKADQKDLYARIDQFFSRET